ncbi:hypothetical protein, partial [Pseudomonas aeruginosa]|uniref:hypothetical protein n=1 Tax=Pseudomonas aeruginosa TaxID=287 RepID=UPI003525DB21
LALNIDALAYSAQGRDRRRNRSHKAAQAGNDTTNSLISRYIHSAEGAVNFAQLGVNVLRGLPDRIVAALQLPA